MALSRTWSFLAGISRSLVIEMEDYEGVLIALEQKHAYGTAPLLDDEMNSAADMIIVKFAGYRAYERYVAEMKSSQSAAIRNSFRHVADAVVRGKVSTHLGHMRCLTGPA